MNTKNQNIGFLKTDSHNFQDSNLKVNRNSDDSVSAHTIHLKKNASEEELQEYTVLKGKYISPKDESKREIESENHNPTEKCDLDCPLPKRNKVAPRLKVSIDFAASQWFQILLIHLNSKNKKLSGVLEPIGGCHLGLNG